MQSLDDQRQSESAKKIRRTNLQCYYLSNCLRLKIILRHYMCDIRSGPKALTFVGRAYHALTVLDQCFVGDDDANGRHPHIQNDDDGGDAAAADGHRVSICFSCSACFGQRQLGPTMHLHIITACFNLLLLLCFGVARFAVFAFDHAFAHNHGECDGHLLLRFLLLIAT